MRAVVVERTGGPEVLSVAVQQPRAPAPGQVVVEVHAAGVNFLDVYQRSGANPMELPFVAGNEGAGVVAEIGEGVADLDPGDRVAWAMVPGTGYAEQVVVPGDRLVRVPEAVPLETAAAVLLQGMTAHYLTTSAYPVRPGETALVTGAAGGTGQLLCQLLRAKGVRVIGSVSTEQKAQVARAAGADEVVLYRDTALGEAARELTGGEGVHVAYDGVGRSTFEHSLHALRRRGTLVLFGAASGPVPPVDPMDLLRAGSVYLTRATILDYVAERHELVRRATDIFDAVVDGSLRVPIHHRYSLDEAAQAHRDLESGTTTGKLLLTPYGRASHSQGVAHE